MAIFPSLLLLPPTGAVAIVVVVVAVAAVAADQLTSVIRGSSTARLLREKLIG